MEIEKNTLYLVATPIGNLDDMTFRAVEVLSKVDFIAAEDTRNTLKLLNHFDIKKPLISYYEHNKREKGEIIANRILSGESCALVTDAGMPAISDPGEDLVSICIDMGIKPSPIPGACAAIAALASSGLPSGRFTFEGFLSVSQKGRNEHLESIKNEERTMIFYEAPHKLLPFLKDMITAIGDREIVIARELTKKFEEIERTSISVAIEKYSIKMPKGEFVIIIRGAAKQAPPVLDDELIISRVKALTSAGMTQKEAILEVSSQAGIPKNKVYQLALSSDKTQ